jgi:hypothetical protein
MNTPKDIKFIYLATPYYHSDPAIREKRFYRINAFAAKLMEIGYAVYSPISQGHVIGEHLKKENQHSHDFWLKLDKLALAKCDMLLCYLQEGWQESKGMEEERAFAFLNHIPMMLCEEWEEISDVKKDIDFVNEIALLRARNRQLNEGNQDAKITKH